MGTKFSHLSDTERWTIESKLNEGCCQCQGIERLVQEPAEAQIIAASGFAAHILISRFVDHLPYYR